MGKGSPDIVEPDITHEKKPPSASRASKRVSTIRPDTGETRKGPKKKSTSSSRMSGATPQTPNTLSTMPEDEIEFREQNELVK